MNKPHDPNVTTDISVVPADVSTSDLPTIPGYRGLREIAHGGMGRVLAAYDLGLDREVAIKILLPGASANRFVRESKITARLPHPGIPPVHALATLDDGSPFLAMKLIAGQTLAEEMKTVDRPRLLQAFAQVCQAVGFAHSRGIIHRDLKPANVMVGAFGEVQVMDWGLAKDLTCEKAAGEPIATEAPTISNVGTDAKQTTDYHSPDDRTQAGAIIGTPAYMAPEQARGQATDTRSDVFALGGILCAILTGNPPFSGRSSGDAVQLAAAGNLVEAFSRLDVCGADAELVSLCRRCLSPMPADRPADGHVVADEFTAYLNSVQKRLQAAERERAVAGARETEQRKRRRVQMALAVAVILLLLGGVAFAWYSDRQASNRRATEMRLAGERDAEERYKRQSIDANLKLAADLRKQYKFKAAEAALVQAVELAKRGVEDRQAEVEQARRDLAFVIQLDDIRYRKWIWNTDEGGNGSFNQKIAAPEYRQRFAEHQLDLTRLDPTKAAQRIAGSAIKAEMVAAIDDWAINELDLELQARLLDIARRADPHPWTDRLEGPYHRPADSLFQLAEGLLRRREGPARCCPRRRRGLRPEASP